MKFSLISAATLALLVPVLLSSCDNSDGSSSGPSDDVDSGSGDASPNPCDLTDSHGTTIGDCPAVDKCAELGSKCHASDTGENNLGNQCHDVGHSGDVAECAMMYDECMAFCVEPDAGLEPTDAGHEEGDAAHDDGSDPMCLEIGQVCQDPGDGGSSLQLECHETGHAREGEACAAIYDDCIALCVPDAGSDD